MLTGPSRGAMSRLLGVGRADFALSRHRNACRLRITHASRGIEGARTHDPTAVPHEFPLRWPESTWRDRDKVPGHMTRLLRME
jgi:hypothetical protein